MRVRRVVTHLPFKDFIKFEWKFFGIANNLHWNLHIFNSLNFFICLILTSLLLGWFFPVLFLASGASIFLLIFQYLKLKKLAHGISIKRDLPKMVREKSQVDVRYTVTNETAFPVDGLHFREDFDGLQSGFFLVEINRQVPAQTQFQFVRKLELDGGMGVKTLNPFSIVLQDELGIFSFKVLFQQKTSVEVYPLIEETPALKTSVSPDTINFGFYDIPKRGDSNLFIGTRDYRQGDPVKHINWKLSLKAKKIILNEYEKNTNSFVTLLIDLHFDHHSGFGESSTWETAKDLALSIAANEIKKNNQIQVISNNLYIPYGSGKNQLSTLERHFTHHELENSKDTNHLNHLHGLPAQSQVYYICPKITSAKVLETIDLLMRYRILGHKVVIFTLDPYDYLYETIKDRIRTGIRTMDTHIEAEFKNLERKLSNINIKVINIEVKARTNLQKQMVKNGIGILE